MVDAAGWASADDLPGAWRWARCDRHRQRRVGPNRQLRPGQRRGRAESGRAESGRWLGRGASGRELAAVSPPPPLPLPPLMHSQLAGILSRSAFHWILRGDQAIEGALRCRVPAGRVRSRRPVGLRRGARPSELAELLQHAPTHFPAARNRGPGRRRHLVRLCPPTRRKSWSFDKCMPPHTRSPDNWLQYPAGRCFPPLGATPPV